MRNLFKFIVIIAIMLIIGLFGGCEQPNIDIGQGYINSASRYLIESYNGISNDKIKYSYSYEGYDFYYIYLGEVNNVPMYYEDAMEFNTAQMEYKFELQTTETTTIGRIASESSQMTISTVDEYTNSETTGKKLSGEIKNKIGIEIGNLFNISQTLKIGSELSWQKHISNRNETGFQVTTSLANTEEWVKSYATEKKVTYTYPLSREKGDKHGWYRYTLFSPVDVYLYVIRDTTTNELVYYEFREHIVPNTYGWSLDYSETMSFKKNDDSCFEFDIDLLENLPPAGTVTVIFDKNNSDLNSIEANPETKIVNLNASIGLMPTPPERHYYAFVGWNTKADGSGTSFTMNTKVTNSITVYAMWSNVSSYKLSINANPTVGGSVSPSSLSNILAGTPVVIEAIPNNGYKFIKWIVDNGEAVIANENNKTTTVILTSDATIKAEFQSNIKLTVEKNLEAGGTINPISKSDIATGESISISAVPNSGYRFVSWSVVRGEVEFVNNLNPSTTVTLKTDAVIRANFELLLFNLKIEQYPENYGTVTQLNGTYSANTPISITASPNSGYKFICWITIKGTAKFNNSNSASTSVTLSSDSEIRAYFLPKNAKFYGEVGKLSLKVTGAFVAWLHIDSLDSKGAEKRVKVKNDILVGETRTADPGDYNIPDGSIVRVFSEVAGGYNKQGYEYFIYRKGNSKTASYTHSGTTLIGNNLKYNGIH